MSGDSVKRDRNRDRATPRMRLVSPSAVLATALVAGLGVLIPTYLATNKELSGWRFLLAVVLASCAIVLLVEGFHRARSGERWQLATGTGVVVALASFLLALSPASSGGAGDRGLRFDLRPTAPSLFSLAFKRPIPLPAPTEEWAQLRRRGGIDIGDSHFKMILANESATPISVLSVRAEILGSESMPHGTQAYAYSQGDEGIGRFVALLPDGRRGSVGRVYPGSEQARGREEIEATTPYFQSRYVLLKPGEVYPASLTVEADTARTIEYRLVAEGESAGHRFVVKSPPYRLVGSFEDPYQQRFTRYYSYYHDPGDCTPTPDNPWIDARYTRRSLACPLGPGHSYETPPLKQSDYPRGKLALNLGLTPGKQSVTISGVTVGAAPAAAPAPGVVRPLLRAIGAWTSCTVFSPTTNYWTASWEPWELQLTFAGDRGSTDCTPRSHGGVQQIELRGAAETVQTNLGPIEIGARVPGPIRQRAEIDTSDYEREYFVPGVSVCRPTETDLARYQLSRDQPGGILAWWEESPSGVAGGVTTTLPDSKC